MTSTHDFSANSYIITLLLYTPTNLSLLYAISTLVFRAIWHDTSWSSMNFPILLGLIHAFIVFWFSPRAVQSISESSEPIWIFLAVVCIGYFTSFAYLYTRWIHKNYVIGRTTPPPLSTNNHDNPLKGKVVLITGANTGIGKELTRRLILEFHVDTVILACRSEKRAEEAMDDICTSAVQNQKQPFKEKEAKAKEAEIRKKMMFLPLDLSSLASVRHAATLLLQTKSSKYPNKLHYVINNAGVMMAQRQESVDGYELTMACNHLGHFLFTLLVLKKMQETVLVERHPNKEEKELFFGKIVTVTSSTYTLTASVGGLDVDNLFCTPTMEDEAKSHKCQKANNSKSIARSEEEHRKKQNVEKKAVAVPEDSSDNEKDHQTTTKTTTSDEDNVKEKKKDKQNGDSASNHTENTTNNKDKTESKKTKRKRRTYTLFGQYAQSKLANILFTSELSKRLNNLQATFQTKETNNTKNKSTDKTGLIKTYSVHPGLVRTDVTRNMSTLMQFLNNAFGFLVKLFQKSPYDGTHSILSVLVSNHCRSGGYVANCAEEPLLEVALDQEAARQLWEWSKIQVKLTPEEDHFFSSASKTST